MPDRDRVIHDIERCICHVPDACRDCSKYKGKYTPDCMEQLLTDALKLLKGEQLKKQEPLVISKEIIDEIYDYIAECPECGMTWAMWYPEKMRFCPGCGRAVKWDA